MPSQMSGDKHREYDTVASYLEQHRIELALEKCEIDSLPFFLGTAYASTSLET